jgi:hypothetical protein
MRETMMEPLNGMDVSRAFYDTTRHFSAHFERHAGRPAADNTSFARSAALCERLHLASPAILAALCVANALFDTRKRRTSRAAKSTNVFIQAPIAPGCQRGPHAQWDAQLSACRACNVRTRTSAGTARDRAIVQFARPAMNAVSAYPLLRASLEPIQLGQLYVRHARRYCCTACWLLIDPPAVVVFAMAITREPLRRHT